MRLSILALGVMGVAALAAAEKCDFADCNNLGFEATLTSTCFDPLFSDCRTVTCDIVNKDLCSTVDGCEQTFISETLEKNLPITPISPNFCQPVNGTSAVPCGFFTRSQMCRSSSCVWVEGATKVQVGFYSDAALNKGLVSGTCMNRNTIATNSVSCYGFDKNSQSCPTPRCNFNEFCQPKGDKLCEFVTKMLNTGEAGAPKWCGDLRGCTLSTVDDACECVSCSKPGGCASEPYMEACDGKFFKPYQVGECKAQSDFGFGSGSASGLGNTSSNVLCDDVCGRSTPNQCSTSETKLCKSSDACVVDSSWSCQGRNGDASARVCSTLDQCECTNPEIANECEWAFVNWDCNMKGMAPGSGGSGGGGGGGDDVAPTEQPSDECFSKSSSACVADSTCKLTEINSCIIDTTTGCDDSDSIPMCYSHFGNATGCAAEHGCKYQQFGCEDFACEKVCANSQSCTMKESNQCSSSSMCDAQTVGFCEYKPGMTDSDCYSYNQSSCRNDDNCVFKVTSICAEKDMSCWATCGLSCSPTQAAQCDAKSECFTELEGFCNATNGYTGDVCSKSADKCSCGQQGDNCSWDQRSAGCARMESNDNPLIGSGSTSSSGSGSGSGSSGSGSGSTEAMTCRELDSPQACFLSPRGCVAEKVSTPYCTVDESTGCSTQQVDCVSPTSKSSCAAEFGCKWVDTDCVDFVCSKLCGNTQCTDKEALGCMSRDGCAVQTAGICSKIANSQSACSFSDACGCNEDVGCTWTSQANVSCNTVDKKIDPTDRTCADHDPTTCFQVSHCAYNATEKRCNEKQCWEYDSGVECYLQPRCESTSLADGAVVCAPKRQCSDFKLEECALRSDCGWTFATLQCTDAIGGGGGTFPTGSGSSGGGSAVGGSGSGDGGIGDDFGSCSRKSDVECESSPKCSKVELGSCDLDPASGCAEPLYPGACTGAWNKSECTDTYACKWAEFQCTPFTCEYVCDFEGCDSTTANTCRRHALCEVYATAKCVRTDPRSTEACDEQAQCACGLTPGCDWVEDNTNTCGDKMASGSGETQNCGDHSPTECSQDQRCMSSTIQPTCAPDASMGCTTEVFCLGLEESKCNSTKGCLVVTTKCNNFACDGLSLDVCDIYPECRSRNNYCEVNFAPITVGAGVGCESRTNSMTKCKRGLDCMLTTKGSGGGSQVGSGSQTTVLDGICISHQDQCSDICLADDDFECSANEATTCENTDICDVATVNVCLSTNQSLGGYDTCQQRGVDECGCIRQADCAWKTKVFDCVASDGGIGSGSGSGSGDGLTRASLCMQPEEYNPDGRFGGRSCEQILSMFEDCNATLRVDNTAVKWAEIIEAAGATCCRGFASACAVPSDQNGGGGSGSTVSQQCSDKSNSECDADDVCQTVKSGRCAIDRTTGCSSSSFSGTDQCATVLESTHCNAEYGCKWNEFECTTFSCSIVCGFDNLCRTTSEQAECADNSACEVHTDFLCEPRQGIVGPTDCALHEFSERCQADSKCAWISASLCDTKSPTPPPTQPTCYDGCSADGCTVAENTACDAEPGCEVVAVTTCVSTCFAIQNDEDCTTARCRWSDEQCQPKVSCYLFDDEEDSCGKVNTCKFTSRTYCGTNETHDFLGSGSESGSGSGSNVIDACLVISDHTSCDAKAGCEFNGPDSMSCEDRSFGRSFCLEFDSFHTDTFFLNSSKSDQSCAWDQTTSTCFTCDSKCEQDKQLCSNDMNTLMAVGCDAKFGCKRDDGVLTDACRKPQCSDMSKLGMEKQCILNSSCYYIEGTFEALCVDQGTQPSCLSLMEQSMCLSPSIDCMYSESMGCSQTPYPTPAPTSMPSPSPTPQPSSSPTPLTGEPTPSPTQNPQNSPTGKPTTQPTPHPTRSPVTRQPTKPGATFKPTPSPSPSPTTSVPTLFRNSKLAFSILFIGDLSSMTSSENTRAAFDIGIAVGDRLQIHASNVVVTLGQGSIVAAVEVKANSGAYSSEGEIVADINSNPLDIVMLGQSQISQIGHGLFSGAPTAAPSPSPTTPPTTSTPTVKAQVDQASGEGDDEAVSATALIVIVIVVVLLVIAVVVVVILVRNKRNNAKELAAPPRNSVEINPVFSRQTAADAPVRPKPKTKDFSQPKHSRNASQMSMC